MASPFAIFRRNQKIMLAVVGIGAMFAFVFLDPLTQYLGQGGTASENPVVVETKYGKYRESDLGAVMDARTLVEVFLNQAIGATIDAQIRSGQFDPRMSQQMAANMAAQWRQRLMGRAANGSEAAAIETIVLANRARELGMVISDAMINDLLAEITFDSLTREQLLSIINSLNLRSGQRVSPARLFEAIRTEMLASNLSLMFQVSTVDVPPAQKFEYFSRINRQAQAEVVPLAVADFTSQVKNPSDEVLIKYFDQFKDRFPNAESPDPGFKEPPKAAFQYFKADFAKLREEMKGKVTEEEIRQYYEQNKAQFLALDLPEDPDADASADAEGDQPQEEKPAGDAAEADKPGDDAKTDEPAAPEEPKAEPAPETEAPPQPSADDEPEAEARPRPEDQSTRRRGVPLRPVSTAAQPDDAADEPAASEPAEETKEPAAEAPAESEAPDAEAPPAESAPSEPAPAEPAVEPAADQPAPAPRFEPLEKVSDQIRDTLAGQKAADRIEEIFNELQGEMRRYSDQIDIFNTRDETDVNAKAPEPFPFAELAKKYGIDAAEVPMVSAADVAGEELGKVFRMVSSAQFGFRRETLPEFAFGENYSTYKPTVVQDNEGNGFLFWKTQEQAAYVPKFDAVRDKVLAAWKMTEARPLAVKRAEELAKQANAAGKPLAEVFAGSEGLKVVETGSFSWLTRGNVPANPLGGPLRVSTIEGLEHIGPGFMQTVFSLPAGEAGVASNEPRDTVYVVRVSQFEPQLEQLRDQFAKERPGMYLSVAQNARYDMYTNWVNDLLDDAGVHWVRQPDEVRGNSRAAM